MSSPARPGLAIASFAAAALIAFSAVALLVAPPASPGPLFYLLVGLTVASASLAAAAAAAYLGGRPSGYRLGLTYVAVGLTGALLQLGAVTEAFGTATVVNTVFPAVTAVVLLRHRRESGPDPS